MQKTICTAAASAVLTILTLTAPGWSPQVQAPGEEKLSNARVRVPEIDYAPNAPKSGDVIWHNKGEDAPVLTNTGNKPYRTLVIEVK